LKYLTIKYLIVNLAVSNEGSDNAATKKPETLVQLIRGHYTGFQLSASLARSKTGSTPAGRSILVRTTQTTRCHQLAFIAAVLSMASPVAAQTAQWRPFAAPADGFQVLFPSPPEVSKNSVPAGGDTYELRSYVAEVGSAALYVGVCDYGARNRTADPGEILANAEKGALEHMAAHILSEKKITLDTGPGGTAHAATSHGIEFEAENDKMRFTTRMYVAAGALYQVMVTSPLNEKFADTARFLDSFQLIDRRGK
jgi:hypothetical protein